MMQLVDPEAVAHIPDQRRVGRRWIAFVAALFLLQVGAVVVMISIATRDRSFALEPDYYQKAMHWDESAQLQRASARLGWSLALEVEPQNANGTQVVSAIIRDREGNPVQGATVTAEWFHHARARERHLAEFVAGPDGSYAAPLVFSRSGLYEFRLTAKRGDETYVTKIQRDITGADGIAQ